MGLPPAAVPSEPPRVTCTPRACSEEEEGQGGGTTGSARLALEVSFVSDVHLPQVQEVVLCPASLRILAKFTSVLPKYYPSVLDGVKNPCYGMA